MLRATVPAAMAISRVSNFWSDHKEGKGFGKWASHPHPIFLGVPPPLWGSSGVQPQKDHSMSFCGTF